MASLTAINCDSSANLYPLINASKSINRVLSNCFSDWQATQELQESWTSNGSSSSHSGHFLTPNLTSHSGRRGASQDADMHKDVTTTTVGHRGSWTLDSFDRIFCYLTGNAKSDTACARALSNWPNASEGGFLPTLSFIDPSTAEQFRMFSPSLMSSSSDSLEEQTRIALTISLLRHYTEFKNDFPTHSLISRISECSNKLGFNMGLINKWEADIYRSFANLNDVSLNLDELGNEVRIPANQISEHMDSAVVVVIVVVVLKKKDN